MKKLLTVLSALMCILLLAACGDDKHEMADDWENDDTYHWYTCTEEGCDIQHDKAEHTWDEGTVTLEPTTTKEGIMTYVCTVCKTVNTEFIKPTATSTVTRTEWEKAFSIGNFSNITVDLEESITNNGKTYLTKYHIEAESGKLYSVMKSYENGVQSGYYGKYQDGNVVYELDSADKTLDEASVSIATNENTSSMSKLLSDYGLDFSAKYDSFAFNDSTKNYDASNISTDKGSYKTVSVSLSDGKIIEIKAQTNEETPMTITIKLTFYGKTTVNPPIKEE